MLQSSKAMGSFFKKKKTLLLDLSEAIGPCAYMFSLLLSESMNIWIMQNYFSPLFKDNKNHKTTARSNAIYLTIHIQMFKAKGISGRFSPLSQT